MKKWLLTILFLSVSLVMLAQTQEKANKNTRITGTVTDSVSGSPLEYATISLLPAGSKKAVNGTTADNKGAFTVSGISAGIYDVVIEFIGYRPYTFTDISITKNETIDLKKIALQKKQEQLKNVTVTTQHGLIENKIDKIVFNAEKDITSQTGVATDVLKKVPMVSVDVDGNVELAGSSGVRFLINGKPSTAFGSNVADVLQSIPASQIKSIEVITNPGAKYDAQGMGGIINIILKQNTAQGVNGNISLTAGTRMENGSFNFNARKGNLGFNAFVSGNARLTANTPAIYNRLSVDSLLKTNELLYQDGNYKFKRHGIESGIGFDWTYKKKNSFTGSLGYDNFGNAGFGIINQSQSITDFSGNMLADISSISHSNNNFNSHNIDAGLNYKRTFDKEDQELEISFDGSFGNNFTRASNYQLLLPDDSLFFGTTSTNPGRENEIEIQADYTQPITKDVILGVGGKLNFVDIASTSDVFSLQPGSKLYLFDSSLSNYLNYHQKVYAVYTELSFPAGKLFDAKIGGRYERTEINSFYSNAQQQAGIPGYNTFVPSVFLIKKLKDNQTIKLSYSKRIERPDYGDLNPFINTADPKNISSGNPYLLPEIGNRYELSYNREFNKAGSFMATIFYRANNHDIQPYITYYPTFTVGDSTYTNVAVSTRQNIGLEKNAGISLFGNFNFNSKLTIRTNLFFFHRHTINAIDPGFNSSSFNYRINMNAAYQFTGNLAAEFFGNFNSVRHEAQGNYPSFTSYSFAIRKLFWNKKGSLALTATNPFNEYITQRVYLFGPNFTATSLRKVPFRSIGINFTWKFGKLEFKKEEEKQDTNPSPPAPEG